jgi:hypothetical protein
MTTDRVAGSALVLLAAVVLVETWRAGLPLGSIRTPGPAYLPVVLALLLTGFGAALVLARDRTAAGVASVGWREWRHAVAIFAALVFSAWALERLGYRLTVTVVLAFLLGVVERKGVVVTVAIAVGLALASFFLFGTVLRVPLPVGPLGI